MQGLAKFIGVPAICGAATAATAADNADARAKWLAAQAYFLHENLLRMDWKQTTDGLQYLPLRRAQESTPQPTLNSIVTVNYEGKLITGKVFDSSYARKHPESFPLTTVIKGWQEGLRMMRVGEIWQFAIPAELAYGNENMPQIPSGSVLLFKVELLKVEQQR